MFFHFTNNCIANIVNDKIKQILVFILKGSLNRYQLKYVNTRSQIDPMAESEYQWWKDRTSREYAVAQNMLTAFPELRKFPDYKMVIGDYIRGAAQRENNYAAQKAGAAKAPIKKAPVQPTRSTAAPASVTSKERDAKNAEAKFRKTATTSNLKDLLLQQFL